MSLIIGTGKREMLLDPPWVNAAGSLGFSDEARRWVPFESLGAFITAPISYKPRSPAHPPRSMPHAAGLLLHTGLPNPGFQAVVRRHRRRWAQLPCPTIVHCIGEQPDQLGEMVEYLDNKKMSRRFRLMWKYWIKIILRENPELLHHQFRLIVKRTGEDVTSKFTY